MKQELRSSAIEFTSQWRKKAQVTRRREIKEYTRTRTVVDYCRIHSRPQDSCWVAFARQIVLAAFRRDCSVRKRLAEREAARDVAPPDIPGTVAGPCDQSRPDGRCKRWRAFLSDCLPPGNAASRFLILFFTYCLRNSLTGKRKVASGVFFVWRKA